MDRDVHKACVSGRESRSRKTRFEKVTGSDLSRGTTASVGVPPRERAVRCAVSLVVVVIVKVN